MNVRVIGEAVPSLAKQIRESVDSGRVSLPPMPQVAARVLHLLREEYAGPVGPLVELIGSDAALAASILRVANSALFGGLRAVSDLRMAIARLGAREVASIVTLLSHRSYFRSTDPGRQEHLRALWDHSVVTALGTRRLARGSDLDPSEAFLAGLLHDTGKLIVLRAFDAIESRPGGGRIPAASRSELMRSLHAELGHKVLHDWRIPEPVCRVTLHHHDPVLDPADALLIRVGAANQIARRMGMHPNPDPELALIDRPEIEALGLGDEAVATLIVDLEEDLSQLRQLL